MKYYSTQTVSSWGNINAAATSSSKSSKNSIITKLVEEFQDRSRSDITKWRQAIQAAENPEDPRWFLLQDLYDNLMTDGHLMANIDLRKAATLGSRFYIQDANGQEDAETTELIQDEWVYNIISMLLDSIFKGYTVVELVNTDPENFEFQLIPRRNCCPQLDLIYLEVGGNKSINYADKKFETRVIHIESAYLFGIINDIVPQLIWKRNAQQVWADFCERFGIPMVTAETMKTDKKEIDLIEDMLSGLGQAAQAVLPEGTKIQIHDASTKGDPHNVFNEQIKTTNSEMSKRLVGGTMLTDDGSSRSQSEVHERSLDYKLAESDRRMIEFMFNKKIIPALRTWGLKIPEGFKFVFDRSEKLSLKEHWEIVNQASAKYEIDQEWIAKTFNIPIKGEKQNQGFNPSGGISGNFS